VNSSIRAKKNEINKEYDRKLDEYYVQHYEKIIEDEIKMLTLFWKKVRLTEVI